MIRISEIKLPLGHAEAALPEAIAQALGLPVAGIGAFTVFKRSFDARKPQLLAVYIVDATLVDPAQEAALLARHAGNPHIAPTPDMAWHPVGQAPQGLGNRPVVVGFGPCGIFAALVLAQMGFKPLVLERGKPVRERTQDTWGLWRKGVLDPESNVQFGEGGAGLFSDGKLYSQIKDPRWLGRKVMQEFVAAGAPPEILQEAHPHIGTFKLVKVVENIRAQIIALGGEIRFQQKVVDVLLENGHLRGLTVLDQASGATHELRADHVVLALGHSARATFEMLHRRGVRIEAKPFSIGFRAEHPQSLIDHARWGRHAGHPLLGAADYKLVHHASNGRAVYSFCMCPGGTVVAATSEPGRVVTNGMSQYSRNERNANAGIVVGIEPIDFPTNYQHIDVPEQAQGQPHALAGIELQRRLESNAYVLGGSNYQAPGQLVGDFVAGRASKDWGAVQPSYQP
ncbi:MAG TPA: FAD-dependent oxidoreductase, partial [Burkholderiaceae bacterium]